MEALEVLLHYIVEFSIIIFEFIGVGIIIVSGIIGFTKYLRRHPDTKIVLAQGLAMGLEFKMGAEILKTVLVRSLNEILILGAIILLRALLSLMIHFEIKAEQQHGSPEEASPNNY